MLTLITALGVGSIVAAFIGWRVAISNNRQKWIDALRDDLATYLRELENMHNAIGDLLGNSDPESEKKKRDARVAILFVYWRIVMRLNRVEQQHIALRERLDQLMKVTERVPNRDQVEQMVDLARQILKREWDVTKYGILTDSVLCAKRRCQPMFGWLKALCAISN